jgi:hypothetical protein
MENHNNVEFSTNDISDLRPSSLNQILKNNMEIINENVIKTEYELHHHSHLNGMRHQLSVDIDDDNNNNNIDNDDVLNLHHNNSGGDKNNNSHQLVNNNNNNINNNNNNRMIISGNDNYNHQQSLSQVMDKDAVNVQQFTRLMDNERSVDDVSNTIADSYLFCAA